MALPGGGPLHVPTSATGPRSILQSSPASPSPALTEANDSDVLFRTTISDAAQGVVLTQLANDLGLSSVCTMFINNAYGQGLSEIFADNFEDAGGTVPEQAPHASEQATYAAELSTCTERGPAAIAGLTCPQSPGVFHT